MIFAGSGNLVDIFALITKCVRACVWASAREGKEEALAPLGWLKIVCSQTFSDILHLFWWFLTQIISFVRSSVKKPVDAHDLLTYITIK
jgi:hypothetical protein